MHGTIPAARKKLIERIAASAGRKQKRSGPVNAQAFIRQYFRGVAEEDLAQYEKPVLATMALNQLNFGATRARNQAMVRVFNIDPERDGWSSTHTIVEVVVEDMPFLVDSLGMVLNQAGLTIQLMIHPIIGVRRDGRGRRHRTGASIKIGKTLEAEPIGAGRPAGAVIVALVGPAGHPGGAAGRGRRFGGRIRLFRIGLDGLVAAGVAHVGSPWRDDQAATGSGR